MSAPRTKKAAPWAAEREFGYTLGIVLGLGDGIFWRKAYRELAAGQLAAAAHHLTVAKIVWGIAIGLTLLTLLAPAVLRPLNRVWMGLSNVLGGVNARLLMGLIYYLVVTPLGRLKLCLGGDALDRRIEPGRASYWRPRPPATADPAHCRKQY